jgi:tetratricopeptide (TPR) repeat protein
MLRITAALALLLLLPAAAQAEDWNAMARAAYARAASAPDQPDAWNLYGYYAYRAGDFAAAEAGYKRSLALRPAFAVGWNNLGALYLNLERYADAEPCFRKALELEPANSKAQYNLAVTRFRRGNYIDALAMFFDLRQRDKFYADLRANPDKAEQELDEAIKREPLNPVLRAAKARFQRYKKDHDEKPTWW